MVILILLAFLGFGMSYHLATPKATIYETLIVSMGLSGLAVVLIAQLWSLGRLLNTWSVALSWLIIVIGAGIFCIRKAGGLPVLLRRIGSGLRRRWLAVLTFSRLQKALLACLLLCFLLVLFQALAYPVVNWDSLANIMPRVFFWIQRGSVNPFGASSGQQLTTYPFAAYALTQVKLLSFGSDLFINTVQWGSFVLACLLVAGITRRLGGNRTACLLSALAASTIPMTLLQAATTQYDLVVAAFILASIYLVLRLCERSTTGLIWRRYFCLLALIAGLGFLTKVTWLLVVWPFLLLLTVNIIRQKHLGKRGLSLGVAACAVLLFLLPTAGWFSSNAINYQGDFMMMHVSGNAQILIPDRSPKALMTNFMRNALMEIGTPVAGINSRLLSVAQGAARAVDLDLNTSVNKENSTTRFALNTQITNHDLAPAPLTALLLFVALLVLVGCVRKSHEARRVVGYCILACLGYGSIAALVTWQPYITRTLMGALMALTPLVGCAFGIVSGHSIRMRQLARGALSAVFVLTLLLAGMVIVFNTTNPLLPTNLVRGSMGRDLGFWNTPRSQLSCKTLTPSLISTVAFLEHDPEIKKVERIGLTGDNIWGQPYYPLLTPLAQQKVTVLPEAAVDGSERFITPDMLPPELIIDFSSNKLMTSELTYQGLGYRVIRSSYMPELQSWLTLCLRVTSTISR